MSVEPGAPAHPVGTSGALARRLDPLLDPVVAVVGVVLALLSLITADVRDIDPRLHEADLLSAFATLIAAGALGWRRARPRASYAVFLGGCLVVSGSFHYIGLLSILLLLSLYSLTTHATRRQAVVGLGVGIGCFLVLGLAGVPDLRTKDLLLSIALLVATWAVAEALRVRREQHDDQLRAVVTEERLRIARELHDVVAHSMMLIAVQAGVGSHVIRTDPAAAEEALDVIADTSRRALEQTRSMLGMLREDTADGSRPPAQGLDDLPALVDVVRHAGLDVELIRTGAAPPLDAAVSLAVYRIVQESLTNVVKHSQAATATVTVTGGSRGLDVEVTDPGPTRAAGRTGSLGHGSLGHGPSGHGLVGLVERTRLVGGALTYGARGRGFCVYASLPAGAGR